MKFTVPVEDGPSIEFECADNLVSRWVCEAILKGKTYPHLPFVDDVQVVFDVGANCGATTVHFARHYPNAEIHAFEPAALTRGYLERNVAALPHVRAHAIGLHSVDQEVPLYMGDGDAGMASIFRRENNLESHEVVQLRAAGGWAREHGVDRIDILKIDVEGCELDVLESLVGLLATVKVLYIEYDSRATRRGIASLLDETHELYVGIMFLDQGECVYLRRDLAGDAATEHLRMLFAAGSAEANE